MDEIAFADQLELLAYNALPGTMTPDIWAHQYDQQSNQVLVTVAERNWTTNGDASNIYGLMPNFPCCLANMHQAWPKFVQHMWMATRDNGLAALVYGPNIVTAYAGKGKKVTIIQQTDYPFTGTVRFTVKTDEPVDFPLYLRIPEWAAETLLTFGNEIISPERGNIVKLNRKWKDGDEIMLSFFPLSLFR